MFGSRFFILQQALIKVIIFYFNDSDLSCVLVQVAGYEAEGYSIISGRLPLAVANKARGIAIEEQADKQPGINCIIGHQKPLLAHRSLKVFQL